MIMEISIYWSASFKNFWNWLPCAGTVLLSYSVVFISKFHFSFSFYKFFGLNLSFYTVFISKFHFSFSFYKFFGFNLSFYTVSVFPQGHEKTLFWLETINLKHLRDVNSYLKYSQTPLTLKFENISPNIWGSVVFISKFHFSFSFYKFFGLNLSFYTVFISKLHLVSVFIS